MFISAMRFHPPSLHRLPVHAVSFALTRSAAGVGEIQVDYVARFAPAFVKVVGTLAGERDHVEGRGGRLGECADVRTGFTVGDAYALDVSLPARVDASALPAAPPVHLLEHRRARFAIEELFCGREKLFFFAGDVPLVASSQILGELPHGVVVVAVERVAECLG